MNTLLLLLHHQFFKGLCLEGGKKGVPLLLTFPLPTQPEKLPTVAKLGSLDSFIAYIELVSLHRGFIVNTLSCLLRVTSVTVPDFLFPLPVPHSRGPRMRFLRIGLPNTISLVHMAARPCFLPHLFSSSVSHSKVRFLLIFRLFKSELLCSAFKGFHSLNDLVNCVHFLLNGHYYQAFSLVSCFSTQPYQFPFTPKSESYYFPSQT